jgi:hypothetical protein
MTQFAIWFKPMPHLKASGKPTANRDLLSKVPPHVLKTMKWEG